MALRAPKNAIADTDTGLVTPEWLVWLQGLAEATTPTAPAPPGSPPTSTPPVGDITIRNDYGSGTAGRLTKWLASTTLGDSILSEAGNVVTVDGVLTALSFQGGINVTGVTGTLAPTHGGTGLTTIGPGELLYGAARDVYAALPDAVAGSVLVSGGVGLAPAWSAVPDLTSLRVAGDGSVSRANRATLTLVQAPEVVNIGGTTTANATAVITGVGTTFTTSLAIGDRIAVSSAPTTYSTVVRIDSDTSLLLENFYGLGTLGNGTVQTINRKRAIFRADAESGHTSIAYSKMVMNDLGVGIGMPPMAVVPRVVDTSVFSIGFNRGEADQGAWLSLYRGAAVAGGYEAPVMDWYAFGWSSPFWRIKLDPVYFGGRLVWNYSNGNGVRALTYDGDILALKFVTNSPTDTGTDALGEVLVGAVSGQYAIPADTVGGTLTLRSGRSTGNADGGSVVFQTTDPGVSGTARRNYTTKMTLSNTGLAMSSLPVTNVLDPVNAQDAATKNYVDAVASGLDIKTSVRVATTATLTLSGPQTIDGVAVVAGNRVLVKNQTSADTNGLYLVAAGAWVRTLDANTSAEVTSGLFTFVEEGTANASTGWVLTTPDPIVLGTTPLAFSQFSGAGVGGSGTAGTYAKWTSASALGNSILSESGTVVTLAGTFVVAAGVGVGVDHFRGPTDSPLTFRAGTGQNLIFRDNASVTQLRISTGGLLVNTVLTVGGNSASSNFVAGTTGWQITSAGVAEFRAATVGGALTATGIITGIGSGLTALPAASLTGTIAAAQMPAFTGDLTTTAGAVATTLATVNANVGTFGSASQTVTVTVNAKGLVTAITQQALSGGGTTTGTGTTGTHAKWSGASVLADSLVSESGALVTVAGTLRTNDGVAATPAYAFASATNTGFMTPGAGAVDFVSAGTQTLRFSNNALAWVAFSPAPVLTGDGASVLAQRNLANPQTLRVYGSYTDSANYERIAISTQVGDSFILQEQAGTGTARNFQIGTRGAAALTFRTSDAQRWSISSAGHLVATTSGAYDIGTARNITASGVVTGSSGIQGGFSYSAANPMVSASAGFWLPRMTDLTQGYLLDYQDEFAFVDKRTGAVITLTAAVAPPEATLQLFRDDTNSLSWATGTSPFPITIEVDLSANSIQAAGNGFCNLGLTFRNTGSASLATNIKIESWESGAYVTRYDAPMTTPPIGGAWLSPRFPGDTANGFAHVKVKVTISGTNPIGGTDVFRLQRLMLYHPTAPWDPWRLHRGGGTMYGQISWSAGLTAINNLLGPSDQPFNLRPGAGQEFRVQDNAGAVRLTGTTLGFVVTGTLTATSTLQSSAEIIAATYVATRAGAGTPAGTVHQRYQTVGGVGRFHTGLSATETGSGNTGSNWTLWYYDDAGAFLGQALQVVRSTGDVSVFHNLVVTGAVTSADHFTGSGSGLTSLPAGSLTGTVAAAQMPAFTGDVTSALGATVNTLATVNATVGTFGSAANTVTLTVNAKGLVTAVAQQAVNAGTTVRGEVPSGAVNGSNTVYTTAAAYTALAVYLNGVRQTKTVDYTETTGTTFTFTVAPLTGDLLLVDYGNAAVGSGKVMQVVNTQTGAVATGTTILPHDDTIPQNTEGDQYMTLAITPTRATNNLKIEVVVHASGSNAASWMSTALFQDAGANALAGSEAFIETATAYVPIVFTHYMAAGTTSATTFKVRAGMSTSGTLTFNGQAIARRLGGVLASSITITEIAP